MIIDCNTFAGNWPFRKIRRNTVAAVEELHKKHGVSGGYISSLDAIFYNDPTEGDIELAKELVLRPNYRHVATVNPALPGACSSLKFMAEELDIAGVRVFPNYHDFKLHSPEFEELCAMLVEYKLPLFITLRMDDRRVEYMIYSKSIDMWDICGFCQRHKNLQIVFCGMTCSELAWLVNKLPGQKNFCAETSGMKEPEIITGRAYENGVSKFMVFGSCVPLFTLLNGITVIENCQMPELMREKIMSGTALVDAVNDKYRPKV